MLAGDHQEIGRGHAERLVPMIAALPDGGRAGRIAVDIGPGSFTGVRIGLSVARALGFAWGAPVVGFESLSLVAAAALGRHQGADRVAAILPGGHGEYLAGIYGPGGEAILPCATLPPQALARFLDEALIAGDGLDHLSPSAHATLIAQLPDASAFPLLSPDILVAAEARYARPPDARPTARPA